MVTTPGNFPPPKTEREKLKDAIETGLRCRTSQEPPIRFLVTARRDLLEEVLGEYRAANWRVGIEHRSSLSGSLNRYRLTFAPSS